MVKGMAHRTAAQRAATKRMLAARRRMLKGAKRKSRGKRRHSRHQSNPVPTAIIVNPAGGRTKGKKMAKRRHGKKHRAKSRHRKHSHWGGVKAHQRRVNPKRRHHRRRHNPHRVRHHRRRRNPGLGGGLVMGGVGALAGGALVNFIDGKIGGGRSAIVRTGLKVIEAFALGWIGRKISPAAGAAAMYGALGTIGGDLGARAAGGLPSLPSKKEAVAGLARMAAEDEEMGVLLTQEMKGMGIVIQGLGAASTDQLLEGYGSNGVGAYVDQSPGYGDGEG